MNSLFYLAIAYPVDRIDTLGTQQRVLKKLTGG